MKIIKFAWDNIRLNEKLAMVIVITVAIMLGYLAMQHGFDVISNQVIGPLVLMAFSAYCLLMIGIMRGRSMAMNTLFVALMKEARDAKNRLGEELDPASLKLVADFLGDNK